MSIATLWSGHAAGGVIGVRGRLRAPRRRGRQLGCLLTILIGIVGAAIGTAIGNAVDVGGFVTFIIQVVAAALLVVLFGAASRR
jgi:uncharacterized membrane protein YeaQ/YmgE (transglycosylase-associated protein family)